MLAALMTLLCWFATPAVAEAPPFSAVAEPVELEAGADGALTVVITVPASTTLYRDMMEVTVLDAGGLGLGEPSLPPGFQKNDPVTGAPREVYELDVFVEIPVTAPPAGTHQVLVEARWQGCKGSLCYMPQTEQLAIQVDVTEKGSRLWNAVFPAAHAAGGGDEGPDARGLTDNDPVGVSVSADGDQITVSFIQKDGWHLTDAMTFLELPEDSAFTLGPQTWPTPHQRPDPAFVELTRGEYDGDFQVTARVYGDAGEHEVAGTVGYQACQAEKCLLPRYEDFALAFTLTGEPPPAADAAAPPDEPEVPAEPTQAPVEADGEGAGADSLAAQKAAAGGDGLLEGGVLVAIGLAFLGGFGVSLTPCVLPMIPITLGVIGARGEDSRARNFVLALVYVQAQAAVYTSLGVFAGYTGSLFGGWLQSTWVIVALGLFFFAMGLAMFGLFDVQVPPSLQTRLAQYGGAGFGGAAVLGMVGALVAGPCSGPVLAAILAYIGQSGQIFLGALLMWVFAQGMGLIFILTVTFSDLVFRPGLWMEWVKKGFGVAIWLAAVWYISPILDTAQTALLAAFVLLVTAVLSWPDEPATPGIDKGRKLYGVVGGLVGAWLLVGTMMTQGFILPPVSLGTGGGAAGAEQHVVWGADEAAALAQAKAENKPVIIDFTADWCAACKELEHLTYSDAAVIAASDEFVTLMIDCTSDSDPTVAALLDKYGVSGLPTVKFLAPDGTTFHDLTLTGFEPAEDFLPRMEAALARAGS